MAIGTNKFCLIANPSRQFLITGLTILVFVFYPMPIHLYWTAQNHRPRPDATLHTHPRALDGKSEQGRYDRLLLPISGQVGPGIRPRYCAWQVPCLLRGATVYNSNLLRADSPPSDTQCQTCAWRNAGNGEAGRWTTTYWCDDHSVRLDFYGTHPSSQCQCGVTTCATPERFSSVDIFFRRHASKSVSSGTVKLDSGHMLNTLSVVPIMKAGVFYIDRL